MFDMFYNRFVLPLIVDLFFFCLASVFEDLPHQLHAARAMIG